MTTIEDSMEASMTVCFKLQECLNNPDTPLHVKQVYFMDHEAEIRKATSTISDTINRIAQLPAEEKMDITVAFSDMLDEAKAMLENTRMSIYDFKQSLTVNKDVSEEDLKVSITKETLKDINELQEVPTGFASCNYILTCGNIIRAFYADENNKHDINACLAEHIEAISQNPKYDPKSEVRLFKISSKEIPLKERIIYTV